ncbi:MAG: hypothetical protein V1756_00195 [Patescibacteria group bacterium]
MNKIIGSVILGLAFLGGAVFAQTSNPTTVSPNTTGTKPAACTQEAKLCPDGSYVSRIGSNCEFAACQSVTSVSGSAPANTATAVKKCGVNTFVVNNECGVGAFKNAYLQCHDGYEENLGGESSCKSSEVWQKYAQEICVNRCSVAEAPKPVPGPELKPLPAPEPTIAPPTAVAKPIAVCYIPDKLTKDYNQLILDLRKAEDVGDKATAEEIIKKITALKLEIEGARKECLANTTQTISAKEISGLESPTEINRCQEVAQWENKIAYYQKLAGLSDSELKEQTGFTRAEVEKILADLPQGLIKVKTQCEDQKICLESASCGTEKVPVIIAEPVKPVAVESGQEINDYYKARIENITATGDAASQIDNLKSLKREIDELIAKLINGRKEIEASELGNAVSEIKVSRGEIKADDVAIQTTDKKIFLNVGDKLISIAPTAKQVLIKDENLEVTASEVSIKDNALRVGTSEVKLTASKVAENLGVEPQSAELKEENSRAVYKLAVKEPRKLLGFIPIQITKTMTADAESSDLLNERLPWYAFLTTRQ